MAGGLPGGDTTEAFDIRSNLRQVLADLKEFDPKLATAVRRRMRRAGDSAIAAMGTILDEESGGVVTGKTTRMGTDRRGRAHRVVDTISTREANRSRSTGAREEIKRGLRLKVTAGKSRTSIRLSTTGGELRKAMNTRSWRHPVFGTDEYVEQPGNQYFNRGARSEMDNLRAELEDAIHEALDALATRSITTE